MAQIGNKQNSYLNGEWVKHGRSFGKKKAARARRAVDKKIIDNETDPEDIYGVLGHPDTPCLQEPLIPDP